MSVLHHDRRRRNTRRLARVKLGSMSLSRVANHVAAGCRDLVEHWQRIQTELVSLLTKLFDGSSSKSRRHDRRAFRPSVGGTSVGLEPRLLMTTGGPFFLRNPSPRVALRFMNPPLFSPAAPQTSTQFPRGTGVNTQTAHGGQSVIVATKDGHFKISLTQFIPTAGQGISTSGTSGNIPGTQTPIQGQIPGSAAVQPIGTVRAYAMGGGKVGIVVDASTTQTELDISPMPFPQQKGFAHSFAFGQSTQSHVLDVGQITVNSGSISAILGYHTADLSGPLTVSGDAPVDRIAFNALEPGATIKTGGDLNTLDVLTGANLSGAGTGINIGRDLNLINVGNDLSLSNGANFTVGRFLGTTPQPAKGTATGSNLLAQNQALIGTGTSTTTPSLAGFIQGNLTIGNGSVFFAGGGIANSSFTTGGSQPTTSIFLVNGTTTVSSAAQNQQIIFPFFNPGVTIGGPGAIFNASPANFVSQNGFNPMVAVANPVITIPPKSPPPSFLV